MFFDIHAHVCRYPYPLPDGRPAFATPEQLLRRHDELGIERAVLLPLVSPDIWMPQSVGEIIEIAHHSGGRFIPFCNLDPRVLSNASDAPLGYLLRYYRGLGCRGIGEVMPNLEIRDARVQNLFRHAEEVGFPLIFDLTGCLNSGYGLYDEPGLPQLEASLARFPRLVFLGHGPAYWAEIARLASPTERYGYPRRPVEEEGVVPRLMRTYPNLWGDLSAASGANALQRDRAYHQGTAWAWLLGPFAIAHYRVYGRASTAWSYLEPLADHLADYGMGTISEIFDGDPPHQARGAIAQAWSVAEVLRAYRTLEEALLKEQAIAAKEPGI